MSAIKRFELAAYQAYRKEVPLAERSLGLAVVSNAIDEYLDRIHPYDLNQLDPWQLAKAHRAIAYLRLLKRDINLMASQLRQEVIRSKVGLQPDARTVPMKMAGVLDG